MGGIVILTGAGVSAESGLGTFRDAGGVWTRVRLEDVATPEGFARDPGRVHAFYNARRVQARDARPNAAHHALARLARARPGEVVLVTQNVDALHEAAGHPGVLHMHGRIESARCAACDAAWHAPDEMQPADPCPACGTAATRPDVVWFGEIPRHMEEIGAHLAAAHRFAAIGTSGAVWPAAGFVAEARAAGALCTELTLEPSEVTAQFHEHRHGPATLTVPAWVDDLLARP